MRDLVAAISSEVTTRNTGPERYGKRRLLWSR